MRPGAVLWQAQFAAGAVVLPQTSDLKQDLAGVRDSKEMSPAARETWSQVIRELAVSCAVGLASAQEIDTLGIVPATRLASSRALENLDVCPDCLLLDYLNLPGVTIPQVSLVKGDKRSLSIAAASILAKTTRDTILIELDERYPGYGFAAHKGYGTASHREAIQNLGPSPVHRFSFAPIRDFQKDKSLLFDL